MRKTSRLLAVCSMVRYRFFLYAGLLPYLIGASRTGRPSASGGTNRSTTLVVRAVTAVIFCFVFGFAAGAIEPARAAESAANVDATRLIGAEQHPADWMTYGRTYSEQRFSLLAQITADNVNLLGLA